MCNENEKIKCVKTFQLVYVTGVTKEKKGNREDQQGFGINMEDLLSSNLIQKRPKRLGKSTGFSILTK